MKNSDRTFRDVVALHKWSECYGGGWVKGSLENLWKFIQFWDDRLPSLGWQKERAIETFVGHRPDAERSVRGRAVRSSYDASPFLYGSTSEVGVLQGPLNFLKAFFLTMIIVDWGKIGTYLSNPSITCEIIEEYAVFSSSIYRMMAREEGLQCTQYTQGSNFVVRYTL